MKNKTGKEYSDLHFFKYRNTKLLLFLLLVIFIGVLAYVYSSSFTFYDFDSFAQIFQNPLISIPLFILLLPFAAIFLFSDVVSASESIRVILLLILVEIFYLYFLSCLIYLLFHRNKKIKV